MNRQHEQEEIAKGFAALAERTASSLHHCQRTGALYEARFNAGKLEGLKLAAIVFASYHHDYTKGFDINQFIADCALDPDPD